jgi:hypothetical protein
MLANMLTTLFILPPLLWFILSRKELLALAQKPKLIFQALGLAGVPLLSYSYIFIRGTLHPEWRGAGQWSSTWDWFIAFLTIRQGRDELGPGLSLQNFFTSEFPALMWQELTWPIWLGGLIGLAFLGRRRAIFLYTTLAIYLIFCWFYRFGNWFQVIIPAYPIFIIGAAVGLKRISESANQQIISNYPITIYNLLIVILMGLMLFCFTTNLPRANQHNLPGDTGLDPGWAILADQPVKPAVISADFPERVALQYVQSVWGQGVGLHLSRGPGDFAPLLPVGQVDNLSYYVTRQAAAAAPEAVLRPKNFPFQTIHPQAAGEQLILLAEQPLTALPPTAKPLNLPFGNALQLAGWEQIPNQASLPPEVSSRLGRANWQIALYWQTTQALSQDYTISVRPLVGGQVITLNGPTLIQDHPPLWGLYPTSRWRPGELVRDVYVLRLPEGTVPESIQVVVYKTSVSGFENLGEQTIVPAY